MGNFSQRSSKIGTVSVLGNLFDWYFAKVRNSAFKFRLSGENVPGNCWSFARQTQFALDSLLNSNTTDKKQPLLLLGTAAFCCLQDFPKLVEKSFFAPGVDFEKHGLTSAGCDGG